DTDTQGDNGGDSRRDTDTQGESQRDTDTQGDNGGDSRGDTDTQGESQRDTDAQGDNGGESRRDTDTQVDNGGDSRRDTHTRGDAGEVHFFPPLYIQRYTFALTCLTQHSVKSVVDFGCSECGLMKLLPTVPSLEEVALVDIDKQLLQSKKHIIEPELRHYIYRRQRPLHVKLMAGSAELTDARLLHYDAVLLIEVIEHLEAGVLERVTDNVFGNMRPRLCVVTTPNSEFNVLFNNDDPKKFRHWDHKFEWSRQQFQQWCQQVCHKYCYLVEYSGVGSLPSRPHSDGLGPCSQAAIFTRQQQTVSHKSLPQNALCYELIAESDFPFEKDILSLEEKIDFEVSYCLRQMFVSCRDSVSIGQPVEIRIADLAKLYTVRNLCDEAGVRESLHRCHQQLSLDGLCVVLDADDSDNEDDDSGGWLLSECHVHVGHRESPGGHLSVTCRSQQVTWGQLSVTCRLPQVTWG
ncbi:unnamed protein product, partial [Candidula unifasciata]